MSILCQCSIFWSCESDNNCTSTNHIVVILVAVGAVVTDRGDPTEGTTRLGTNPTIPSNLFKETHIVVAVRSQAFKRWSN